MKDPNWIKCLINGDSKDIIKRIPDNSIDFILTDPPYNLGKHSTGNISLPGRSAINNDIAQWDMLDFNPEEWADEFVRILKPTGNLFIFTSYNQLGRWYNCLDNKFDTTNFMIWHKTNPAPKIFKAGFLNSCEMIFTCWNKKHTWNFLSQAEMHNFIESPICMRPERLHNPKHPSQKPVRILKRLLEIASNEKDIVFDPFMGVGSTGVACMELNRRFIGIEIDKEYFRAGKERIENILLQSSMDFNNNDNIYNQEQQNVATEPVANYGLIGSEINYFFKSVKKDNLSCYDKPSKKLSPIIKWPGGKEKELKYIYQYLPSFERYFEPFVGGGSVFMAINSKENYINDFSRELIDLYENIAKRNEKFFEYAHKIDNSWKKSYIFFIEHPELVSTYVSFRNEEMNKDQLKSIIKQFCLDYKNEIIGIVSDMCINKSDTFILPNEMEANLCRKMFRMKELELQKNLLSIDDINHNIETAIKSAVYMFYRKLYNIININERPELYSAIFLFIRNYAYSGMFRYSNKGDFNVPYGGIGYNSKLLEKKLEFYKSPKVKNHFNNTQIFNLDFEIFLEKTAPTERDFIFLDPPYDTEFSTYAKNTFTKEDQTRLANYLIEKSKAKWMLIIKNTDFIYNLYNKPGIIIRSFEKSYTVSFMNRNDKNVTHLLITNY